MSMNDDDQSGQDIPALREAAKRGETAAKERDEAVRKLALVEAGVDTKSAVGKLFTKSYDGPLDQEAIAQAWAEVAPAATTPPPPVEEPPATPVPNQAGLEETQTRSALTAGGAGTIPLEEPPPDPVAAGYEEFHKRIEGGERRETAAGAVFGHLISSAAQGDERAIVQPWTPEQLGR